MTFISKLLSFAILGTCLNITVMASSSVATVYVDPASSVAAVGETFLVNVTIDDVTNLYGWEFRLYYETGPINATGITEGPFLKSAGQTFFFVPEMKDDYNETHGCVWVLCTLIGAPYGVNGSGVLATISFIVTEPGDSVFSFPLHFYEECPYPALLVGDSENLIPCTSVGGYFAVTSPLSVAIAPDLSIVQSGETLTITVEVTWGTSPVVDVLVILSSDKGGNFSLESGYTDSNGRFSCSFTAASVTEQTVCTITANATKAGYFSGHGQTQVTVNAPGEGQIVPFDYIPFLIVGIIFVVIIMAVAVSRKKKILSKH